TDVAALLPPWHARARERLAAGPESELAPESQLPEISAWRRAYAQMGLKPTQYRSAAEALLRRFRREGDLPRVHPLVDVCNALSLAFALPVAVFDLAGVAGHLEVRPAEGGEEHVGFGGEVEHAEPGEVIFADADRHARARRRARRRVGRSPPPRGAHRLRAPPRDRRLSPAPAGVPSVRSIVAQSLP